MEKRDCINYERGIVQGGILVGQDGANEVCPVSISIQHPSSVNTCRQRHTSVVDLPRTSINRLEQLIDFIVGHFLPEVREDYTVSIAPAPRAGSTSTYYISTVQHQ